MTNLAEWDIIITSLDVTALVIAFGCLACYVNWRHQQLSFPLIFTRLKIPLSKLGIVVAIQKIFASVDQTVLLAFLA